MSAIGNNRHAVKADIHRSSVSFGALPPHGADWGALLAYAFIAQVCGWLVIGRAMPRLSAGVLGLCLLLQPLLAYVWDMLLFGTRLDGLGWIGLALSLAGIFLGLTRKPTD